MSAGPTTPVSPEAPLPVETAPPAEPSGSPRGRAATWYRDNADTIRIGAGLAVLFTVASIFMAFPHIHLWRTHTPGDYGDSFLLQWLLRWDFHALVTRGSPVFDPNIYWPHENTLLFTDTELAIAPVAGVIAALTDWTIAYNVIYLSGWVISLAATHLLARWLGASRPAAVLAALVFTFSAVRLGHYNHFQLQFSYFVPLSLYLLLRFLDERRWWQAAGVGACFAATFLNAGYVAVALAPTLAIVAAGWVVATRFRPGPRLLRGVALAGLVAFVPTAPVLATYRTLDDHLQRDYYHPEALTPRHLLAPVDGTWFYGWLASRTNAPYENRLFPGFIAIGLGAAGVVARAAGRGRKGDGGFPEPDGGEAGSGPSLAERARVQRRGVLLIAGASLVPFVLAFGKYQTVQGRRIPLPFTLVADWPGFQSIRAFGRFAVVPVLAGALVAAVGYDRLLRGRPAATRRAVALVVGGLMLLEYKGNIVMAPRIDRPELTAVNHALARLPHAAVLELPMGDSRTPAWAFVEAPRLVLSSIDWRPRVNGYSGYEPTGYHHTLDVLNSLDDGGPASAEALARIQHLRIAYIVVRLTPPDGDTRALGASYLDEDGARRVVEALPPDWVEDVSRHGAALLIRLRPPPGGRPASP